MQTQDDGLSIVSNWLEAIITTDWEGFSQARSPDISFVMTPQGEVFNGIDAVLSSYRGWCAKFSELRVEIADGFSCDNRVAVHMIWTGTTIKGGRSIRFPSCFLIRIEEGKIVVITDFYDQLTYKAQLSTPESV